MIPLSRPAEERTTERVPPAAHSLAHLRKTGRVAQLAPTKGLGDSYRQDSVDCRAERTAEAEDPAAEETTDSGDSAAEGPRTPAPRRQETGQDIHRSAAAAHSAIDQETHPSAAAAARSAIDQEIHPATGGEEDLERQRGPSRAKSVTGTRPQRIAGRLWAEASVMAQESGAAVGTAASEAG
jgi:hypothetical protein